MTNVNTKLEQSYVVVCFFDAYPPTTGSGAVCYDFFKAIKSKKKLFLQYSKKNIKKKDIKSINIIKNNFLFKIIFLPIILFFLLDFLRKQNTNRNVIIEGPSWAFYSFFLIFFLRFFIDTKIVYRSHSIEWEIRKRNSNLLIAYLTKFFEKKICQFADIVTSVSVVEQKKFIKYYSKKTYLFPNSISFNSLNKIKSSRPSNVPKKFIFYCGSYNYGPNRSAINILINKIMPRLSSDIKLILTGDCNLDFYNPRVLNYGIIDKSYLKFLYNNCLAIVAPIFEGYGTRIKFIEALFYNCLIITTNKGFEGLDVSSKNVVTVNSIELMIKKIKEIKEIKKEKKSLFSLQKFSMEKNTTKFIKFLNDRK
jgi:hypothetical protein